MFRAADLALPSSLRSDTPRFDVRRLRFDYRFPVPSDTWNASEEPSCVDEASYVSPNALSMRSPSSVSLTLVTSPCVATMSLVRALFVPTHIASDFT